MPSMLLLLIVAVFHVSNNIRRGLTCEVARGHENAKSNANQTSMNVTVQTMHDQTNQSSQVTAQLQQKGNHLIRALTELETSNSEFAAEVEQEANAADVEARVESMKATHGKRVYDHDADPTGINTSPKNPRQLELDELNAKFPELFNMATDTSHRKEILKFICNIIIDKVRQSGIQITNKLPYQIYADRLTYKRAITDGDVEAWNECMARELRHLGLNAEPWAIQPSRALISAALAKTYKVANCGEMADLVFTEAIHWAPQLGNFRVEAVEGQDYDHSFVAFNRYPNTDIHRPADWNNDAVICDGWTGDAMDPKNLQNVIVSNVAYADSRMITTDSRMITFLAQGKVNDIDLWSHVMVTSAQKCATEADDHVHKYHRQLEQGGHISKDLANQLIDTFRQPPEAMRIE